MSSISKGYMFAYISVCLSAMYNLIAKVSLTYDISPVVFIGVGTMAASVTLFYISGPGSLSFSSFKSPRTSLYALFSLLEHLFTIHMFIYVAGAEGSLMQRINMFIAVIIALVFLGRKPNKFSIFGSLLVITGVSILIINLEPETRVIAVFWMLMATLFNTSKTFVAEKHPESNQAKTFKEQARVTAFVRFVTSSVFLLFIFITAIVKYYAAGSSPVLELAPDLLDFVHPATFICALVFGVLNNAPTAYFYFYATKMIKSEKFIAIAAMVPIITLAGEYVLGLFGQLEYKPFTTSGYFAMFLIMIASILMGIKPKPKKVKLSRKNISELNTLRETIMTAKIAFNDDMDLVASKLGVGKRTLDSILKTDKEVSKSIKNKIIYNHAENVAGIDHLTGCLNKISFDIKLQQLDNIEKALLLFIDLDKFKPVNDTYGHDAGDAILKGIAERLMDEFKHPHITARLGGDEYCVLIYGADKQDAAKYKSKVSELIKTSFIIEGIEDEISVGCSTGAAHYPIDTQNGLELKGLADKEMYKHKESKGGVR